MSADDEARRRGVDVDALCDQTAGDFVHPTVARMLEQEGVYIAGDRRAPHVTVVLSVMNGKVYSMKIDEELDPRRFFDTVTLKGPYTA